MGTVLVRGQGSSLARSTDHGATWTYTTISGWSGTAWDACWFGGNFVSMNTAGDVWKSRDGLTWTAHEKVIRDPAMSSATPRGVAHRSLVSLGTILVAPWGVDSGGFWTNFGLLWSTDGVVWHQSGALGRDVAPTSTSPTRELSLVSSTPAHAGAPFSPLHQLLYAPGHIGSAQCFLSSVEFCGIEPRLSWQELDEASD